MVSGRARKWQQCATKARPLIAPDLPGDAARSGGGFPPRLQARRRQSPTHAGVAQLVERNLPKVDAEGSSPFARSI